MIVNTAVKCLKSLVAGYSEHRIATLSAALAYYTLFSIAPILLISTSIVSKFLDEAKVKAQILSQITAIVGIEPAKMISNVMETLSRPAEGTFAYYIGILLLLFAASGIFSEIQSGLNNIWGVTARKNESPFHFIFKRILAFLLVFGIGFLFLLFMVLSLLLATLTGYLTLYFGEHFITIGISLNYLVSFFVMILLFALIFKVLPDIHLKWRNVLPGALITAVLYTVGKSLLGIYFRHSTLSSLYGVSSSLIILLVWVYYSSQIFFIGAEITRVLTIKNEVMPLKNNTFRG